MIVIKDLDMPTRCNECPFKGMEMPTAVTGTDEIRKLLEAM